MVLVTIVHVVSPCWKYCDCVVMVLVTLQDVRPRAIAAHVTKAVAIVTMILYRLCLFIMVSFFNTSKIVFGILSRKGTINFVFPVQKYNFFLTLARKSPTSSYLAGDFFIFAAKGAAESGNGDRSRRNR